MAHLKGKDDLAEHVRSQVAPPTPFQKDCLKGQTALITGGASGLGLEIARDFCRHGANVVIMGRRQKFLDEAVSELKSSFPGVKVGCYSGDVRSEESGRLAVKKAVEVGGKLDILVNSAAGNFLSTSEMLSTKGFKTVMDIDTVGTFNMSLAAFPELCMTKGRIINISATLHYGATWYQVHASAAKSAIDSCTRTQALEWGRFGIRVNGIAPGPIAGTAGMMKLSPDGGGDFINELVTNTIPLGIMGQRHDISRAAVFLSCSASNFVSGHVLVVDGAQWIWKPQIAPPEMIAQISKAKEKKSRSVRGTTAKPTSKM